MLRRIIDFLLLGGLLLAVTNLWSPVSGSVRPAATDDELLYREARRLGLERTDPIVRRRLLQNMRFIADGDDRRSEEELLRDAFALRMDRSDVVVRRRLAQAVEQKIRAMAREPEPTPADLEAYMARHPESFVEAEQVRFTHAFLDGDRHGETLDRDARLLRSDLVAAGAGGERISHLGDPFLLGPYYGPASIAEISQVFGRAFASQVMDLAPGQWSGPIRSSLGVHFARVEERIPARRRMLIEVRDRVGLAVLAEREEQQMAEALRALRARYPAPSSLKTAAKASSSGDGGRR